MKKQRKVIDVKIPEHRRRKPNLNTESVSSIATSIYSDSNGFKSTNSQHFHQAAQPNSLLGCSVNASSPSQTLKYSNEPIFAHGSFLHRSVSQNQTQPQAAYYINANHVSIGAPHIVPQAPPPTQDFSTTDIRPENKSSNILSATNSLKSSRVRPEAHSRRNSSDYGSRDGARGIINHGLRDSGDSQRPGSRSHDSKHHRRKTVSKTQKYEETDSSLQLDTNGPTNRFRPNGTLKNDSSTSGTDYKSKESKDRSKARPKSQSRSDRSHKEKTENNHSKGMPKITQPPLGSDFIKATLAEMRRTISSDDLKPDGKFQTNLTKRSQSYEPKIAIEQMENKYAAKTDLRKNIIAKKSDKKKDEQLFAEKLLQRKLASEPGAGEGTNFKPRTDYDNGPGMVRTISTPDGTGTEIKKRSNTRRLSLPDVDPHKQDRPDTRIHSTTIEEKTLKRTEDLSTDRASDRETKKNNSKTEIEVVRRNTEVHSDSSKSGKERKIVEIVKPKSKSVENDKRKEKDEKSKSSKPMRPPLPSQSELEPTSKSDDISQKSKPDPTVVYQNPDDPFGKKEVFVPPPKKPGSVKDMAKMFGSNVGLENVSLSSNRIEGACHGIPNSGNTCYIAAILQCLNSLTSLKTFFIDEKFRSSQNSISKSKGAMIEAFYNYIGELNSPLNSPNLSLKDMKKTIEVYSKRLKGNKQEDAQEFLRILIEALHDEVLVTGTTSIRYESSPQGAQEAWNRLIEQETSFLFDLFVGLTESILTCSTCKNSSKTFEPFWDLSLSISGQTSLPQCLNEFQKIEHLNGDESPFCEKCDKKQSMTKQIKIARCPDILILHLKRFCSSRSKYDQLVHSPTILKVRDTQFHLTSMVNHIGVNINSGHYIATVRKDSNSEEWIHYDDDKITKSTDFESPNGYILFYTAK